MPVQAFDVVVVGAGVVGAACAQALSAHGLQVAVVDRGELAGATTSAGEGNILVSDKAPGPELELALRSRHLWPQVLTRLADELGPAAADVEWQAKGGLVVATDLDQAAALAAFAAAQRLVGVRAQPLTPAQTLAREPLLRRDLTGAMWYPDDAQVQPTLAATAMLAAVRARGGIVRAGVRATGLRLAGHRLVGLRTSAGDLACAAVVNACGPWSAAFAETAGVPLAVQPRRGVVLVTAPVPGTTIRHKVYDADYVGAVASDETDLATSTVVESTAAGTILIGSSRQQIGFDDSLQILVIRALAAKVVALFPDLATIPVMRVYGGFRPYVRDHLPVIGPDPRCSGLWHATGHEGAGVGLAVATGELLADLFVQHPPRVHPAPFRVERLLEAAVGAAS